MAATTVHRLDGLEPDNLLAFLAALGLLRALEADDRRKPEDEKHRPRLSWSIGQLPLRPRLHVAFETCGKTVAASAARGIDILGRSYDFDERKDLNHTREEAREALDELAHVASPEDRDQVDLVAALMTDAAIKDEKKHLIEPTPLCLMFGQGHQHFLDRLASVPKMAAPPPRKRDKKAVPMPAEDCLTEALFEPWHRSDPTFSFRWDPEEDVRYALMAGDPTDAAYKHGSQHGANRLAAIGLATLTVSPQRRGNRIRTGVPGAAWTRRGMSFAWPIWPHPASLSAIRCLLGHPRLRQAGALSYLGVSEVFEAQRISVGKFLNFTRALPIVEQPARRT